MRRTELEKYKDSFPDEIIQEIIYWYESGEKVVDIIKAYGLEIQPNELSYFMPPKEVDKYCPYCCIKMKQRRNRNKHPHYGDTFCSKCGHTDNRYCNCDNCKNYELEMLECKKAALKDYYSSLIPDGKIPYKSLNFKNRCLLFLFFLDAGMLSDFNHIGSQLITTSERINLLKDLYEEKIIYISPDSSLQALMDIDLSERIFANKVDYFVNVKFTVEDELIFRSRDFPIEDVEKEDVDDFFRYLIYTDLITNFEELLKERHIDFSPSEVQRYNFWVLLDEVSYCQAKYLCYKVATYCSDLLAKNPSERKSLPRKALGMVQTFYFKQLAWHGSVYSSNPEFAGEILKIFIHCILKEDISVLADVI